MADVFDLPVPDPVRAIYQAYQVAPTDAPIDNDVHW